MFEGLKPIPRHGMLYFRVLVGAMGATKVEVIGQAVGDEEYVSLILRATQETLRCFGVRN